MTEFGEVLLRLMESRDLRGPADLARLMQRAGHDVPEHKITALVEGEEWVDGHFPRWVAEVLDLDAEEMGILAGAVAYGQTEYPR